MLEVIDMLLARGHLSHSIVILNGVIQALNANISVSLLEETYRMGELIDRWRMGIAGVDEASCDI
jgi:hypothetical protein